MSVQALRPSWVSYAQVSMQNDTSTTVHVALDVHKDSIVAAYSVGLGEVQNPSNVGVLERQTKAVPRSGVGLNEFLSAARHTSVPSKQQFSLTVTKSLA